jgi:chromosome segregation ATPase
MEIAGIITGLCSSFSFEEQLVADMISEASSLTYLPVLLTSLNTLLTDLGQNQLHLTASLQTARAEKEALQKKVDDAGNNVRRGGNIIQLETEKSELLVLLQIRQQELDDAKEKINELITQLKDAKEKTFTLEKELAESQGKQMIAGIQSSSLTQEMEMIKKQNEWLQSELDSKMEEFQVYRKTKSGEIISLQSLNESLSAQYEQLSSSNSLVCAERDELANKSESLASKCKRLSDECMQNEEQFKNELATLKRVCDLQEKSLQDHILRINELETYAEEIQKEIQDREVAIRELEVRGY